NGPAPASDGGGVPATPASHKAWHLASVTVMTALTSAARDRRRLSTATMFTVPANPGEPVAGAAVAASAAAARLGAAAQLGSVSPTVAAAATPSSRLAVTRRTST